MKIFYSFLSFFIALFFFAQSPAMSQIPTVFEVETYPVFPGCNPSAESEEVLQCFHSGLQNHVAKHLVYPKEAITMNVEGTVFIKFNVDKSGMVNNVSLAVPNKKFGHGLEEAALEAISGLPMMTPATQGGKPVTISYTLPISFRLK